MLAAKNSNDCSTHRWTTHQRQKSLIVNDFSIPVSGIMPNTYRIAMLRVAAQIRFSRRMRPDQNCRVARHSISPVGHKARNIRPLQISRPAKKPICQTRPSWMYERPWLPNQNQDCCPIWPMMPSQFPISAPATMIRVT